MHRHAKVAIVTLLLSAAAIAQEPSPKTRLQLIEEEVAKRRKMRDALQGPRGFAFTPYEMPDAWFKEKRDLKIDDATLATCGQTLSTLARKEVLVSARVSLKQITFSFQNGTPDNLLAGLMDAISAQGIAIVPVGQKTLVLVDSSEVSKR